MLFRSLLASDYYGDGVDMWAMGTVMVFLIAHEYAFVDESGRLMPTNSSVGIYPSGKPMCSAAFLNAYRMQQASAQGGLRPLQGTLCRSYWPRPRLEGCLQQQHWSMIGSDIRCSLLT